MRTRNLKFQAHGNHVNQWFLNKPLKIAGLYTVMLWLAISGSVPASLHLPATADLARAVGADYMTLPEYVAAQEFDAQDVALYQKLFSLHKARDWAGFDEAAAGLKRRDLMPWLLGERYADAKYKPTMTELAGWLALNSLLPQSKAVYLRLATMEPGITEGLEPLSEHPQRPAARRSQPASLHANMTPSQRSVMKGAMRLFTSRNYKAAHQATRRLATGARKTLPGAWWIAGLSAYHLKQHEESLRAFESIARWAEKDGRSEWLAQSHYWASRVAQELGRTEDAAVHLAAATKDRHSFYGLLANAAANEEYRLQAERETLSTRDVREPVLRLIAMASQLRDVGQVGDAEKLLRGIFTRVEPQEQKALIWTASALKLDNLQLPLASRMAVHDLRSQYPMPAWHEQLKIDPALVLAIVRRESGFDPNAGSHAGAQGLMQLIPSTYHYMVKKHSALDVQVAEASDKSYLRVAGAKGGIKDPSVNLTVGQSYLRYLQEQPYIGQNIVYLIAAYNAGPGNMQAWAAQPNEDPLLFIESIPYRETRDYVKNVMADYWIYSGLMERSSPTLESLSQGQWPESAI